MLFLRHDAVDALVTEWVSGLEAAVVVDALRAVDVACAPVRSPNEALASLERARPQMVHPLRQTDGTASAARAAGMPYRFSRSEVMHDRPAPRPGGDTAHVLKTLLGLDDAAIAALARDAII